MSKLTPKNTFIGTNKVYGRYLYIIMNDIHTYKKPAFNGQFFWPLQDALCSFGFYLIHKLVASLKFQSGFSPT